MNFLGADAVSELSYRCSPIDWFTETRIYVCRMQRINHSNIQTLYVSEAIPPQMVSGANPVDTMAKVMAMLNSREKNFSLREPGPLQSMVGAVLCALRAICHCEDVPWLESMCTYHPKPGTNKAAHRPALPEEAHLEEDLAQVWDTQSARKSHLMICRLSAPSQGMGAGQKPSLPPPTGPSKGKGSLQTMTRDIPTV